jgi:hypothetical protein
MNTYFPPLKGPGKLIISWCGIMRAVLSSPKEPPAFSAWLARRQKKHSPTDLLPFVSFAAFSEVIRLHAASHAPHFRSTRCSALRLG